MFLSSVEIFNTRSYDIHKPRLEAGVVLVPERRDKEIVSFHVLSKDCAMLCKVIGSTCSWCGCFEQSYLFMYTGHLCHTLESN